MVVVATIPSDDVTPLTPSGEHQFNVILLLIRHASHLIIKRGGCSKGLHCIGGGNMFLNLGDLT